MRHFWCLLFLILASQLQAQSPDISYFQKVPSRYIKPGLSNQKSMHFSRAYMPCNSWIHHPLQWKFDIVKIKITPRTNINFAMGTFAGYARQKNVLYKLDKKKAKEISEQNYIAPLMDAGVTFGFFFPYFLSLRYGIYYGWENAEYRAKTQLLMSDYGGGVEYVDNELTYLQNRKTGLQSFFSIELYRPWRARSESYQPFGWTIGYNVFPELKNQENKLKNPLGYLNIGIYWHWIYK